VRAVDEVLPQLAALGASRASEAVSHY